MIVSDKWSPIWWLALPNVLAIGRSFVMLKSDYYMNYLVLIYYEAEICNLSSKAGGGGGGGWGWIMHCRKSMHGFVGHVHSNAFVTSKWYLRSYFERKYV